MAGKKLQGQVAIVTGAGRGIGAATARRLVTAGAKVILTARSEEELEAVAAQLRQAGGRAIAVPGDITDLQAIEEVIESALDQFDRVDILINNAGVAWPIDEVVDADADEWTYNIFTNLIAPFYLARMLLPLMLDQRSGRIIHLSSGAAQRPFPGLSAYCAAKAGLDMFAKTLALELAGSGVTTNILYPGMVDTPMQEDIRSVDTHGSRLDFSHWHEAYEQGALLAPETVADLIYWLVGPWSGAYNGEIFFADDDEWVARVKRDLA